MVVVSEPFKMQVERILFRGKKMLCTHTGRYVAEKGCPRALRKWPGPRSTVVRIRHKTGYEFPLSLSVKLNTVRIPFPSSDHRRVSNSPSSDAHWVERTKVSFVPPPRPSASMEDDATTTLKITPRKNDKSTSNRAKRSPGDLTKNSKRLICSNNLLHSSNMIKRYLFTF